VVEVVEVEWLVEALSVSEALCALEALAVLAERSQQAEGVVGAVVVGLLGFPHLLAMGVGARWGAGLFFDLVVEAAW